MKITEADRKSDLEGLEATLTLLRHYHEKYDRSAVTSALINSTESYLTYAMDPAARLIAHTE